jgi:hypothetical protein
MSAIHWLSADDRLEIERRDVHRRVGINSIEGVTDLQVLRNVQTALIEILRSETGSA